MATIADLSSLEPAEQEVLARLERFRRVWVIGAVGTGRSTLAANLALAIPRAHLVELPSADIDASLHGLVQVAANLPERQDRVAALDDNSSPDARAAALASRVAATGQTLIVQVPGSWELDRAEEAGAAREASLERAKKFLEGLVTVRDIELILVTERAYSTDVLPWNHAENSTIRLKPVGVTWDALEDEAIWGSYIAHARIVRSLEDELTVPPSPIAVRLAVGLASLGVGRSRLLGYLQSIDPVRTLARQLVEHLSHGNQTMLNLLEHVVALAQVRLPLGRAECLDALQIPGDDPNLPFLTQCVAYGTDHLRMTERVRHALSKQHGRTLRPVHDRLANAYAALDGAPTPIDAEGLRAAYWMERVYHLARGGTVSETAWDRLIARNADNMPRELLWDRARAMSRQGRNRRERYAQAAALFDICRRRDPHDAYSCHYYYFNQDRAGALSEAVIAGFREAALLDPTNPWWNSRLVTVLIKRARFDEARQEWQAARLRVDPDGRKISANVWLAENFHYWVAREWIDHAYPGDANAVLNAIPPRIVSGSERLTELRQRVLDALEVELLHESVYPADFPVERRWEIPENLPVVLDSGERRLSWHPARVVAADATRVRVVFATTDHPRAQLPEASRVLTRDIAAEAWELATRESSTEAADYYLLGVYEDGRLVGIPLLSYSAEGEGRRRLTYWKRWRWGPHTS